MSLTKDSPTNRLILGVDHFPIRCLEKAQHDQINRAPVRLVEWDHQTEVTRLEAIIEHNDLAGAIRSHLIAEDRVTDDEGGHLIGRGR